jgi:hypothetical protein
LNFQALKKSKFNNDSGFQINGNYSIKEAKIKIKDIKLKT